ncbi:hypothetical protein PENTCL1PPCAC_14134, partial [Pristionchus entomophagus]
RELRERTVMRCDLSKYLFCVLLLSVHMSHSEQILETQITWADFEQHPRTGLGADARFGANKSVLDIGEGNGFASRCGLIYCDWVGGTDMDKLPTRVVLKIPSSLSFRKIYDALPADQRLFGGDDGKWEKMEGHLRGIHQVEVVTYEFFEAFEGLKIPKRYYGMPFSENKNDGQICLEYMENSRMMNFHEKHTVEQVKQKAPTAPELLNNLFEDLANTMPLDGFLSMYKGAQP